MKTQDLQGAELDYLVAKVLGGKVKEFYSGEGMRMVPTKQFPGLSEYGMSFNRLNMNPETMEGLDYSFHPSTNWSQGGPLIEKYRVCFDWLPVGWDGIDYGRYEAACMIKSDPKQRGIQQGETHLIAAMRAIVASVYGDEINERHE